MGGSNAAHGLTLSDAFAAEPSAPALPSGKTNHARGLLRVSAAMSYLLLVGGSLVLWGWARDIGWLKTLRPEWPTMKANTALCFFLSGAALWLQSAPKPSRGAGRAAVACAALIGVTALLTLCEHFLGIRVGIDQLLFDQTTRGTKFPGRMSGATALGFALASVALAGLRARSNLVARVARWCAVTVGVVGLLTAVVSLYGVKGLFQVQVLNTIAVHTTCLLIALSVGASCVRPGRGPLAFLGGDRPGSAMARRLLPLAIAAPVGFGSLSVWGEQAGYYGLEFGLALFTVANVLTFTVLAWRVALWLNASDDERSRSDEAVQRLAAIVESSDDAIVGKDISGLVYSWNGGAERLFGYAASEMIGQPIMRLIPVERQDEEIRILSRIRAGESVRHFETVRQAKDGRLIDISVTVSPIRNSSGIVIGASKVARDIHERRRLDDLLGAYLNEIADLNATLEARVAQRTDQLKKANATLEASAAQLSQQRAELERSNRDLEQFAQVASHDLQEPLRGVAGCGQILERRYLGQLDAGADELIGHIVEGATRMQTLILDLLAYSTIATKGGEFAMVDSGSALRQAVGNLQTAITESGAKVTTDPLPNLKADPVQLTQVFQNLIGNALKYRGTDPPLVHVGFQQRGKSGEFEVRDNGIGIEPQYSERIFQIFQRLHTRNEYSGNGIGLALCKKIVERHGGRIWLHSEARRGATFRFTLLIGE